MAKTTAVTVSEAKLREIVKEELADFRRVVMNGGLEDVMVLQRRLSAQDWTIAELRAQVSELQKPRRKVLGFW